MDLPYERERVRVVIEGEVTRVDTDNFEISSGDWRSNVIFPEARHVVSVETLHKLYKVGDKLVASKSPEPPIGTAILCPWSNTIIFRKENGTWSMTESGHAYAWSLLEAGEGVIVALTGDNA